MKPQQAAEYYLSENLTKALQYLYYKQTLMNMWIDDFINVTTEDEKIELFRCRKEIEKICQ